MKEKITTGYSELQILLKELGVKFTDCGPAEKNLGRRVHIIIGIEAFSGVMGATLFFDIDAEGNETYVGQE